MQGNGYIYFSRKTTQTGKLSSCTGAMAGLNLDFFFADCSSAIVKALNQKDITGVSKGQCGSPPSGAIIVGFDIGVRNGVTVAVSVR